MYYDSLSSTSSDVTLLAGDNRPPRPPTPPLGRVHPPSNIRIPSFRHIYLVQQAGREKINKAAVKAMSMIEARRVSKMMGVEKVTNFDELKDFMNS